MEPPRLVVEAGECRGQQPDAAVDDGARTLQQGACCKLSLVPQPGPLLCSSPNSLSVYLNTAR